MIVNIDLDAKWFVFQKNEKGKSNSHEELCFICLVERDKTQVMWLLKGWNFLLYPYLLIGYSLFFLLVLNGL